MKDITFLTDAQGEVIGEQLHDQKYPWKERKLKTFKLAWLYEVAGWPDYATRAATCSTWLQYLAMEDGMRQLHAANFCKLRLCPLCIARRAKQSAYKLSQVMDRVDADHPGTMYLFLTLTVKNCEGIQLGDTIGQLTKAWKSLIDQRQIQRSIKGWFRAVEITRNGEDNTYHPHIHAILAVEPGYFAKKSVYYITHAEWLRRWRLALKVDYDPSVRIQTAKAKGECCGARAAAVEAAKYATKDSDYIDPKLPELVAADIVDIYTRALRRRRLTAFGGWMKEAAAAIGADDLEDGDLVHIDQDTIRADVADLIEDYGWHFGAGDYVLTDRRINPLKVTRDTSQRETRPPAAPGRPPASGGGREAERSECRPDRAGGDAPVRAARTGRSK